jgi:hypothetical protein
VAGIRVSPPRRDDPALTEVQQGILAHRRALSDL